MKIKVAKGCQEIIRGPKLSQLEIAKPTLFVNGEYWRKSKHSLRVIIVWNSNFNTVVRALF